MVCAFFRMTVREGGRLDKVVGNGRASRWVGWKASAAWLPTPCQELASTGAPGKFCQLRNYTIPQIWVFHEWQNASEFKTFIHVNAFSICVQAATPRSTTPRELKIREMPWYRAYREIVFKQLEEAEEEKAAGLDPETSERLKFLCSK